MTNTELTKIREDKKLSKGDFAKLLGITPMLLGRYEKGSCVIPEAVAQKLKDISDAAAAAEIEIKKTARKAVRTAKEAVETAVQSDEAAAAEIEVKKTARKTARNAKELLETAVTEMKEAVGEEAAAAEIEVKKAVRKGGRKAKETAEKAADALKKTIKKTSGIPNIIIQSPVGGSITSEDIAKKVPDNTADVYVRVDENKLYYVLENGETGDVDIWE